MTTINTIQKFIEAVMDRYSIPYGVFFSEYNSDDQLVKRKVFPQGKIDDYNLNRICRILGFDQDVILNADKDKANIWFNKYPYFRLMLQYRTTNYYAEYGTSPAEGRLLSAIFGKKFCKKYLDEDIKQRLLETLKRYDSVIPHLYHPDATIERFMHSEQDFVPFDQVELLVQSFVQLVERHKELFFKIWHLDLTKEEINEYNFLTTVLDAEDLAKAGGYLYHHKVLELLPIFKKEGFEKYESYVKICKGDFKPWKCPRFADNFDLAQQYINIFPRAKENIREFCMQIRNIHCGYTWSDDEYVIDEDDAWTPEEFRIGPHQPLKFIYVPKTEAELGDDLTFVEKLSCLAAPPAQGGLVLPQIESPQVMSFMPRMMDRVSAGIKKGEND